MKGVFFGSGVNCFSTEKYRNVLVAEVIPTNDVEPKNKNGITEESVKFLSKGFFVSDVNCMISLYQSFNPFCSARKSQGSNIWVYNGVMGNDLSDNMFSLFTQYHIPRPVISIREDTEESIANLPGGEEGLDEWCSEYVESILAK